MGMAPITTIMAINTLGDKEMVRSMGRAPIPGHMVTDILGNIRMMKYMGRVLTILQMVER